MGRKRVVDYILALKITYQPRFKCLQRHNCFVLSIMLCAILDIIFFTTVHFFFKFYTLVIYIYFNAKSEIYVFSLIDVVETGAILV